MKLFLLLTQILFKITFHISNKILNKNNFKLQSNSIQYDKEDCFAFCGSKGKFIDEKGKGVIIDAEINTKNRINLINKFCKEDCQLVEERGINKCRNYKKIKNNAQNYLLCDTFCEPIKNNCKQAHTKDQQVTCNSLCGIKKITFFQQSPCLDFCEQNKQYKNNDNYDQKNIKFSNKVENQCKTYCELGENEEKPYCKRKQTKKNKGVEDKYKNIFINLCSFCQPFGYCDKPYIKNPNNICETLCDSKKSNQFDQHKWTLEGHNQFHKYELKKGKNNEYRYLWVTNSIIESGYEAKLIDKLEKEGKVLIMCGTHGTQEGDDLLLLFYLQQQKIINNMIKENNFKRPNLPKNYLKKFTLSDISFDEEENNKIIDLISYNKKLLQEYLNSEIDYHLKGGNIKENKFCVEDSHWHAQKDNVEIFDIEKELRKRIKREGYKSVNMDNIIKYLREIFDNISQKHIVINWCYTDRSWMLKLALKLVPQNTLGNNDMIEKYSKVVIGMKNTYMN